jgi:glutathione reductase (NADPH)
MMEKRFDLVVIGTGTAASTVASLCRSAGWEVAVIDSRPFGGTCALRGCDPKKVLVGAADLVHWARRMNGLGINDGAVRIHWPDLIRFKRTFTDPVPKSRAQEFAKQGIHAFHGRARFVDRSAVAVGDEVLKARKVVIATGAEPVDLKIPGQEHLTTSDRFLDLDALPSRIVFIGGGYVSFEFAHVAARAGSQVTILHRGESPLNRFDPDLVNRLVEFSRKLGIDVRLRTQVQAIEKGTRDILVKTTAAGRSGTFSADLVVHGAGRVPEIKDLDLANVGVEDEKGIKVNEFLQSVSNEDVYAAGDAVASGGFPLTPVAGYQGRVVAANLLQGNHRKAEYVGIPSVVFTIPPLALVGELEGPAKEKGLRFKTRQADTASWYSSRRLAETCSAFKTLVEDGSDRILGASVLGPHAEEVINIFALAIRFGITAAQLREKIFAYPTNTSDIAYML